MKTHEFINQLGIVNVPAYAGTQNNKNKTENITVVENPIIVTQNGSSKPLILMEILPKVQGVIVVARGAGDVRVRLDLLNAIRALLEVNSENIQIFVGN